MYSPENKKGWKLKTITTIWKGTSSEPNLHDFWVSKMLVFRFLDTSKCQIMWSNLKNCRSPLPGLRRHYKEFSTYGGPVTMMSSIWNYNLKRSRWVQGWRLLGGLEVENAERMIRDPFKRNIGMGNSWQDLKWTKLGTLSKNWLKWFHLEKQIDCVKHVFGMTIAKNWIYNSKFGGSWLQEKG